MRSFLLNPYRETYGLWLRLTCLIILLSPGLALAQNGSLCYKPLIGPGTSAGPVGGSLTDVGFTPNNTPANLIDGNTGNFAEISNLLTLASGRGVTVSNANTTYPAGWFAGYVVELGDNGLLNANVLSGIEVQTFNDGAPAETRTFNSGLGVTLLSDGSPDKVYLSFETTLPFDEVRLVKNSLVNLAAGTSLRVYYATAFDPGCGTLDQNGICYDQIAGNETVVNFGAGLLGTLATLSNPDGITDGDKNTYATLVLPAGTNLLASAPFVGVKSLQTIYPSGNRVGFVVQQDNGLLTADLLNTLRIQTYLHGELQDDQPLSSGNGLLAANVLAGTDPIQELSILTTAPFNEVRLVAEGVMASLGTLRIYYAFENPESCTDCKTALTSSAAQPYTGELVSRDRDPSIFSTYNTTGVYGLTLGTLTNTSALVSPSLTDSARFAVIAGLLNGGARMTVKRTGGDNYPVGTVAGFAVKSGSGLLSAGLLSGITIRLYEGDGENPVQTITGASLLNLGLLSSNGLNFIGGKSTVAFDEIEIDLNLGAISLGLPLTFDVFYAYVQIDTDGDGVPDCNEICGAGQDDSVDSDGDGTPDACDACSDANDKSAVVDTDGDGLLNNCDPDSDNDGIPDSVEDTNGNGDPNDDDADGDGVPNYLDLDSDNDGILDLYESGIDPALIASNDADENGVLDTANPIFTNTPRDTDGDGVPDYLDLDSDNDGIPDLTESGLTGFADADNNGVVDGPDADNDGVQDSVDGDDAAFGSPNTGAPRDTDGDNVPDAYDLDSDNDGINDIIESGIPGLIDANNDGIVDGPDADGDGISDSADTDDETFGSPGAPAPINSDNDDAPDYIDLDSDNDTRSDLVESGQTGYVDADDNGVVDGPDSDGDGIMDSVDGNNGTFGDAGDTAPQNTDGTDEPDYRDTDSNNDGTNDIEDNGRGDLDPDDDGMVDNPVDPDNDGIPNNNGLDFQPDDFGGLGTGSPDLSPGVLSNGSTYNVSDERDVVVTIFNTGETGTSAPVVFTITKLEPTFGIAIPETATNADVFGGTAVDNSQWTITEEATRYVFTLKDGFSILPTENKKVVLRLTATGTNSSNANLTVRIIDGTGGSENPITNNILIYKLSINL
ncbi:hypothetical protein [Arundinibacter roseus]|uniref:DUF11 domain-containing protein n=1 Tax=Arundinibacter roseus TaxID=2070510 RepID=A0A4R4KFZ8_9BACT|nr:hypothetical protein [Arundinibacter roseus]TDB65792.1 hypothetical protein EZE20_08470 [Arundinibacter roseus]